MNALKTTMLAIATTAALAGTSIASAEPLLSIKNYGNELERCVAQIRADINAGSATELEHRVTQISKDGAWYRFTIETSAAAETVPVISTCEANRFNELTRLDIELPETTAVRVASS